MYDVRHSADPSRLGSVEDVDGSNISVRISDCTPGGILFVNGEAYRVGQVGGFVRIPAGYADLFGIVSQVGAGAAPIAVDPVAIQGSRWLRVELVGESRKGKPFERGISQYPSIGDPVHVATESDLRTVYTPGDEESYVSVGKVASAESISAQINLNRLVSRHSAVIGSTGSGKSTAVASLLGAISDSDRLPGARVVLLDLHGEYARALGERATVFRVNPRSSAGEKELSIPYWALAFDEMLPICFGSVDDRQRSVLADHVVALKRESLAASKKNGNSLCVLSPDDVTVDTPIPFRIKELWFRQHCREYRMVTKRQGGSEDDVVDALVMGEDGKPEQPGDSEALIPPKYKTSKTTGSREQHVVSANEGAALRQQMGLLHSRLRDRQLQFLFSPGHWNPNSDGCTKYDLDVLLGDWMCSKRPITVIDLSGIPSFVLDHLIGAMLRILFDAAFWGRQLPTGGRMRPLLVVLEEAHRYLNKGAKDQGAGGSAATAARRIAKEGRKYGVGMMLVSQRPSEIDPTILSQCGTMVALRLTNEADRSQISSISSDSLKGLFSMLPILRTHEALIVGEAVNMPIRARLDLPLDGRWPDSEDPPVVVPMGITGKPIKDGGWSSPVSSEDYKPLVHAWRNMEYLPRESVLSESTQVTSKK